MSKRIHIWVVASLIVGGAMALTASLMEGLRFDSVAVLIMLIAVWVTAVWLLRKVWMALMLCAVCIPAGMGIPLPFLWKVEMLAWMMVTITGLAVLKQMVTKEEEAGCPFQRHKLMLVLILAVVVRVIVDMPGSSQMGSRGGLSIALSYLAGVFAFPFGLWIGWHEKPSRNVLAVILLFGLLAYVIHLVLGSMMPIQVDADQFFGPGLYRGFLFTTPAWLLLCCILGLTIGGTRSGLALRAVLFIAFSVMGTGVAFVSVHRAFPVYAMTISSVTAWAHHHVKYMIPLLAAVGAAITVMVALHSQGVYLPEYLRRPMSLFTGDLVKGRSGEYGWENTFRVRRMEEFLNTVRERPLTGRGFSYSSIDMKREVATAGHFALLQSYHNSFFTVIGAVGVPVGLTLSLLVFWLSLKSAMWVRRLEESDTKLLAVALMGFLVVSLMHASVQGGGLFLGRCLLVLGILCGLRDSTESTDTDRPATEPAT